MGESGLPPPPPPLTRDAFHHAGFSNLRAARSLLEHYLPAPVALACDWRTLRNLTPVFKSCFEPDSYCDLLFSVHWRGDPLLLHVLFEHQSRAEPLMPLRMLRYMVRIWDHHLLEHPQSRQLPPIYPLVLHQGSRPWRAPVRFHELFACPPEALRDPAGAPWAPDFAFQLIDLAGLPFAQLREALVANALLYVMKLVEEQAVLPRFDELAELIRAALGGRDDLGLLQLVFRYLYRFAEKVDTPAFRAKIQLLTDPNLKDTAMTLHDQLIAEGVEKGREQGLEQGRAEALIATLERLLTRRFGPLPGRVQERLRAASIDALYHLADQVLDAPSLDALFPPEA